MNQASRGVGGVNLGKHLAPRALPASSATRYTSAGWLRGESQNVGLELRGAAVVPVGKQNNTGKTNEMASSPRHAGRGLLSRVPTRTRVISLFFSVMARNDAPSEKSHFRARLKEGAATLRSSWRVPRRAQRVMRPHGQRIGWERWGPAARSVLEAAGEIPAARSLRHRKKLRIWMICIVWDWPRSPSILRDPAPRHAASSPAFNISWGLCQGAGEVRCARDLPLAPASRPGPTVRLAD